ncbi:MAG: phenylacetate-CoA oxygenase subunit PaaJ, partial [Woeseiaceae bacterium]|nr:phenylacetate-CoA oxygenase subunit PaaJ [Gammaproteobacteria bacterium]NNK26582.1 phenylacetate-CoA oxygenase subunit PaaJ [Woeseiaceae bacterium]
MVGSTFEREQILEWLAEVADPEIPVLTITDLGIVRDVECDDGVTVSLTPTYSGCPATEAIETSVVAALEERGVENVRIKRVLSPPWTTDWISDAGLEKLEAYGIAPPERGGGKRALLQGQRSVACPQCAS